MPTAAALPDADDVDNVNAALLDDEDDLLDFDENEPDAFVPFKPRRVAAKKTERMAQAAPEGVAQTDAPQSEADFHTTYTPSRHEKGWLLQSLRPFYEQDLLADVQASVKGGKEASVYRCLASPALAESLGTEFVAAKVYRPREFRNLRNDSLYREGRSVLTADGSEAKKTDSRLMRALGKKTDYGKSVAHTSWLMHEYTTLSQLHEAGASVPRPIAHGENALLMEFIGDDDGSVNPAPTLSETGAFENSGDAKRLFDDALRNIELFLQHGFVHGDLSAYNILYRRKQIVLIDFPQIVRIASNPHAFDILARDVSRVCDYFIRQGVSAHLADAHKIARTFWSRYGTGETF